MHFAVLTRRTLAQVIAAGALVLTMGFFTTGAATASSPSVTSSAVPALRIVPDSANTCSGSVCIYVTGTGLNVSNWATSATITRAMCSTANFLVNGVVWAIGAQTCGPADSNLVSVWSDPGNFANGTQLCNTWSGVSGEPCITVHS
jgi:hypothetical protein